VSAGDDMKLRVWELSMAGTHVSSANQRTLAGHQGTVWALEWIQDHSLLASAGDDGRILFWPPTALMPATPHVCHDPALGNANSLCCDGDGLGCEGQYVVEWRNTDLMDRRRIHALLWVSTLDPSSTGTTGRLLTAWDDGKIRFWSYNGAGTNPSWTFVPAETIEPVDRVFSMVWLAAGSKLATASKDSPLLSFWTLDTSAGTHNVPTILNREVGHEDNGYGACLTGKSHCDAVNRITANSAGTRLISASTDKKLFVWDATDLTMSGRGATVEPYLDTTSPATRQMQVVYMDSENFFASSSAEGEIHVMDFTADPTVSISVTINPAHTAGTSVNALVWIPQRSALASGGADGSVHLWSCN